MSNHLQFGSGQGILPIWKNVEPLDMYETMNQQRYTLSCKVHPSDYVLRR